MGDQPDFVTSFHNLEGDLKGERTKNLYKLLRIPSLFKNDIQLESTLKNLKPTTYQQHLFYIDTLIYFKRTNELLEILKGGNDVFISKVLKHSWFFISAFQEIEAEKFVNDFLPCLSYSIRKKLLTKVSKDWSEEKMDSLFDTLYKKYGLTEATSILHNCTAAKIKLVVKENELKLRPNQVLNLYKKDEDVFKFYLEHINYITHSRYDENKVLRHIAKTNPKLLIQLENDKKVRTVRVGKRSTKSIVNMVKDDIPSNHEFYFKFLHNAVVIRKLGKNFEPIYKQLFPRKFNHLNLYSSSNKLLEFYPKSKRWNLFLETCTEMFPAKTLNDILMNFNSLKTFNPPTDIVEKWAELHYQEQVGNFKSYLKYYEPSKAITTMKEKINVTSDIFERKELVCLMIATCKENKDLMSFEQVLKYICFRHRNEDVNFRTQLLQEIQNSFNMEDFNENHWKYIDEQIKILRIQKEFHLFVFGNIVEKHLEFLLKNGKDYKTTLTEFINDMVNESSNRSLTLKDLSMSRRIYTDICKNFSEAIDKSSPGFRNYQSRYLLLLIDFSASNLDYCVQIKDFSDFVNLIQESFAKTKNFDSIDKQIIPNVIYYNIIFPQYAIPHGGDILKKIREITEQEQSLRTFSTVLNKILPKRERSQEVNDILVYYFDNLFENYPERGIVRWFFKNEPRILVPYISTIVKNSVNVFNLLDYNVIKHYSHLNFDKKICNLYKNKLDDENIDNKKYLIEALRILFSADDFSKLVNDRYLPKKDKLDLEDVEMRAIFNLQCEVAKMLANVNEPYKMLPTIMKFCRGDYLQPTLQSLYRAFYRSPEKILYPYLETLSKQAVSARKHAVYLSCEVLDYDHTLNILKSTSENNASSQKHLFSATLKYFLKNPSVDLFHKVVESMNSIDVNDVETLDSLKDVTVPTPYRARYLEKCWEFFEGLGSKGMKINSYLEKLLQGMRGEVLTSISEKFITNIIKRYFPVIKQGLSGLYSFIVNVLQNRPSERSENLKIVFDELSKFPSKNRKEFFQIFIREARNKYIDERLVYAFDKNWDKHFNIIVSFDEHISLKLILLKFENPSPEQFASSCVKYLDELVTQMGYYAYEYFRENLKDILGFLKEVEKFKFFMGILKFKVDTTTCILVLDLITPIDYDENKEAADIYKKILKILKNIETPIVRINYNSFVDSY